MTIKVYLAAGFFNDFQNEALNYIEKTLDSLPEFDVFSPRRETKLDGFEKPEVQQKVFDLNCKHIEEADLVVASTVDKDCGTLFECGYANKAGIPIIYTLFDARLDDANFNLMLSKSGIAHFTDELKFMDFIKKLTKKNIKTSKVEYEGEFE